MTGEELYALYEDAFACQDCAVDEWSQLTRLDQDAWNEMAHRVDARYAPRGSGTVGDPQ